MWKRNLPPDPTEVDVNKASAYPPSKPDVILKKIYTVFDKGLNTDPSLDIKRILQSILSGCGYDVKGDIQAYQKVYAPF